MNKPAPNNQGQIYATNEDAISDPSSLTVGNSTQNLSLLPIQRFAVVSTASVIIGLGLGFSLGSSSAGYRFRAENAHHLPKTKRDWYFYHKSKGHYMMLGGFREGVKFASKLGIWSSAFILAETSVDAVRGNHHHHDCLSSLVAAACISGIWSYLHNFSLQTTARTVKIGSLVGLGYGIIQDFLLYTSGRPIWYIKKLTLTPSQQSKSRGSTNINDLS